MRTPSQPYADRILSVFPIRCRVFSIVGLDLSLSEARSLRAPYILPSPFGTEHRQGRFGLCHRVISQAVTSHLSSSPAARCRGATSRGTRQRGALRGGREPPRECARPLGRSGPGRDRAAAGEHLRRAPVTNEPSGRRRRAASPAPAPGCGSARLWPGLSAAAAPLLRAPALRFVARSSALGPGAAALGPARGRPAEPSGSRRSLPSPLGHAARRSPAEAPRAAALVSSAPREAPAIWAKAGEGGRGQPRQNGRNARTWARPWRPSPGAAVSLVGSVSSYRGRLGQARSVRCSAAPPAIATDVCTLESLLHIHVSPK